MMHSILLLEDDAAIASTVVYALEREGWQVTHAHLLREARGLMALQTFDVYLLDVGLPDGNGLDLCRELRQAGDARVLMLSARGEEMDRVLGLELGADDYMAKPFSPRELVARVRALLRRAMQTAALPAASPFTHDEAGQRISLQGQWLDLTRREYGVLALLLAAKGRILSREHLFERIWGLETDSMERTVDTHIKTLRAKLKAVDAREFITTHRGMGYSLDT
ncbi:MAG: two-component system response regulator CreB [Brachymonas sp.]|nr:two-component system response regulator CreB [Brachymonas sp.]